MKTSLNERERVIAQWVMLGVLLPGVTAFVSLILGLIYLHYLGDYPAWVVYPDPLRQGLVVLGCLIVIVLILRLFWMMVKERLWN